MAFRKSASVKIGGKFLATGESGSGKSCFAITFPKVGAIDSEVGLAHYEGKDIEIGGKMYNNIEFVDDTSDLDELESDLDEILDGDYDDKIETLVIDSETKFYNNMVNGATEDVEKKAKLAGKNADTRKMWSTVKMVNHKLQQAKITLSGIGKHIVSVAQGKWNKDEETKVETWKIEAHASLMFDYDTVLRFYTETDKKTKEVRHFAEVLKDRTNVTKKGDIIENCTYDVWKAYYDNMAKTGKSINVDYSKDLKTSTESVLTQVEKNDNMATEIKSLLKKLPSDKQREVKGMIDELGVDVKELSNAGEVNLSKLVTFIKSL